MSLWLKTNEQGLTALVAGVGRPDETTPRYLALAEGRPAFWAGGSGPGHELVGSAVFEPGVWHSLAVSVGGDGVTHLFADGAEVASGKLALGPAAETFEMAPTVASPWHTAKHFGGWLAQVSLRRRDAASRGNAGAHRGSRGSGQPAVRGGIEGVAGADAGAGGDARSAGSGAAAAQPRSAPGAARHGSAGRRGSGDRTTARG